MSSRAVLVLVGILFSIYCLAVVILTVIGLNFPTFHLSSFLVAGFTAIYGVLSPIGLSGILGGLHRRRNLIKGFMFQYWFASGLIIGISVGNVLLSSEFRAGAIRKCQSALFGTVSSGQNTLIYCTKKVQKSESAALIFASVQGAVLVSFGILVLIFGIKEFKDILLEEETKSLLEKAKFQEDSRNSTSDTESNISGSSNISSNSSTTSADNGRYPVNVNVSNAPSRSDQGHFTGPNRAPGVSSPYSSPASNVTANRADVTTNRGAPPGHYQPPGNYQPIPPKNNYSSSNKNNYPSTSRKNNYPSSSRKNNYPSIYSSTSTYSSASIYSSASTYSSASNYSSTSKKNNYPLPSSKNNYPLPSKSNSSPIVGPNRSGPIKQNTKLNNYSSQPLPLENYSVALPERPYVTDRYGSQTSSARQPTIQPIQPSSNWNYPPNTRQPAMVNKPPPLNVNRHPSPVPASRPQQQKIKKGYQASGNDYANDYNDYMIPSNAYNIRAKTYAPNLTRGGLNQ